MEVLIEKARVDDYYKGDKRDYLTLAVPEGGKVKFTVTKNDFPEDLNDFDQTFSLKSEVKPIMFGNDQALYLVNPKFK